MQEILNAITECAKTGKGNLLELAVAAAKERATVGEITQAMEVVSFLRIYLHECYYNHVISYKCVLLRNYFFIPVLWPFKICQSIFNTL